MKEFAPPAGLCVQAGVRSAAAILALMMIAGCMRATPPHPAGDILYRRYCASCHGIGGTGDGPVAPSLRNRPTDLTTLAQRSGGRFDEAAAMAIIDGRQLVTEHGPREMPVWGVIFDQELKDEPFSGYTTLLQARVLADYLRSIQAR